MPVESGTTIGELNELWPLGSDPKSQGDDHIRLVKEILKLDAVSKDVDFGLQRINRVIGGGGAASLIVGPIRIQWGAVSTGGTNPTQIDFGPFDANPRVFVTVANGANHNATVIVQSPTQADLYTFNAAGVPDNVVVYWLAVGSAAAGDQLPQEIETAKK